MALEIRLLGTPAITRDGIAVRLAGRKPWGLLAMLLLDPGATSRRELIARLTPEADDPQAALRWLLHQVRRALHPGGRITEDGTRLRLELDDDTTVDVTRLLAVEPGPAAVETLIGGELLAGMDFPDAPALELWLSLERTRMHGVAAEALWWAATQVAEADPVRAMQLVRRGLDLDPYCETKHELIVELHLRDGNVLAAQRHADAVGRLYRDELGIEAPDWVQRPLSRMESARARPGRSPAAEATARALVRSAESRLMAGDGARALETARRGLVAATGVDDPKLETSALLVLARAITQTGRAPVAEAKGLLTRVVMLAGTTDDHHAVVDAQREVGVALLLEGNYGAADAALGRSLAGAMRLGDEGRIAKAETYRGVIASDTCRHAEAVGVLEDAVARFARVADQAWLGYAEAMLARSAGRSRAHATALRHARTGHGRLDAAGWVAALPWSMLAEGDALLGLGDEVAAERILKEALALAEEIGDPTTEGLALRGLGKVAQARGDRRERTELLTRALAAVCRFADGHAWATASILTDLVELEDGRDAGHRVMASRIAAEASLPDLIARLSRFQSKGRPQTEMQTVPA